MLRSLKVTQPRSFLSGLQKVAGTNTLDFADANVGYCAVEEADIAVATTICTKAAHGLQNLDKVQVDTEAVLPTGLVAATDYWVIWLSVNTFALAASYGDALAGTALTITDNGTGKLYVYSSIVTSASLHGFITGDRVRLTNDGGALPTGLATGTDYWVVKLTDYRFALASNLANSLADTRVQITLPAAGGVHTITATDKLAGFDSIQGYSLQVQATGIYRITFPVAYGHTNYIVMLTSSTVDLAPYTLTKNSAYVDVKVQDIDETQAFKDGHFDIMILASEQADLF